MNQAADPVDEPPAGASAGRVSDPVGLAIAEVNSTLAAMQKQNAPEFHRRSQVLQAAGNWAQIAALLLGVYVAFFQLRPVSDAVERIEAQTKQREPTIISPQSGSVVADSISLHGFTPYSGSNHYIVVTPLDTPEDWIERRPVTVHPGGIWTGIATIGTSADRGKEFLVRIVVTSAALSVGRSQRIPEDAISSVPVLIRRAD